MKDGFLRVAAATPEVKVADPVFNREAVCRLMKEGEKAGAKVMVFPELCLTAYTCGDLFLQDSLLLAVKREFETLVDFTKDMDMVFFVGLPWEKGGKLYNAAAVIKGGRLLGVVPKKYLPNYSEFYELRHFKP